jgi:uncharacterized protein YecE (DUF72 family)
MIFGRLISLLKCEKIVKLLIKTFVMKNVDVEIYLTQLFNFFENNPNDLMSLIGELQKDEFFNKLRERCEKNFEEGKEIVLTRQQIIDVVVDMKIKDLTPQEIKAIKPAVYKTKFGDIILN